MPKISACIISFDEEAKIEACLASLQGVVDEIVVVDSNSSDRTVEIARTFTDRVITQDWLGMGKQKAFAYEQASHDWILNLDCDERLTPKLVDSIRKIRAIPDGQPIEHAYEFARRNFYVYRWLNHVWYPEWRTRLFDRRRCEVRGTDPHEAVHVLEGVPARLQGDLQHYAFDSLSDHLRTIDTYTDTAAQELLKANTRVRLTTPLVKACCTFVRLYVLNRGFLDGFAGLCVGVLSGVHSFLKYSKVLTARWRADADS